MKHSAALRKRTAWSRTFCCGFSHRLPVPRRARGQCRRTVVLPPHWRRATGYSLNEFLKPDGEFNPARLLASSEGTLAAVLSATIGLVPTPKQTALVLLQFDELVPAMAATSVILETEPSAIELMDRMLISLTREQPGYASQIAFIS